MRKEGRLYVLLYSILNYPGYHLDLSGLTTVLINIIQKRNKSFERITINQYFKNMTYEEIIKAVGDGAKFTINFEKRTMRLNRKVVDLSDTIFPALKGRTPIRMIECLYKIYKHSIPSERSKSHRRYYFKALREKELSDSDMMYGDRREVARCRLELYVLLCLYQGQLTWDKKWGTWFWQSDKDKDLIILRDWIEPNGRKEASDE